MRDGAGKQAEKQGVGEGEGQVRGKGAAGANFIAFPECG